MWFCGRMCKVLWLSSGIWVGYVGCVVEDVVSRWLDELYGFDNCLLLIVDFVGEWLKDLEVEFWCFEICIFFWDGFDCGQGLLFDKVDGREYFDFLDEIFCCVGQVYFGVDVVELYWFDDGVLEWKEIVVV